MHDLRITLIQSALQWEDPEANREQFSRKLEKIVPGTTDLVLLPEMFTTGFTMNAESVAESMGGLTCSWLQQWAVTLGAYIMGSVVIKDGSRYYNRLLCYGPEGDEFFYNKRHLFRMAGEEKIYTAGTERLTLNIFGWRVRPFVCYDLRFPVWCRSRHDCDLMLFVANWPERRSYPWKQLLIARAIENQCYVAGVNRVGADGNDVIHSGDSVVLNSRGEALTEIAPHEEKVLTVKLSLEDLQQHREAFPVWMDSDDYEVGV